MTQPEGFVEAWREDHLCLVLKALYGTKYAPYLFGEKLKKRFIEAGFKKLTVDVYTQVNGNEYSIIVMSSRRLRSQRIARKLFNLSRLHNR